VLKRIVSRLLGPRYPAVREALTHGRLTEVEDRLERLERRARHDLAAMLAHVAYGPAKEPASLADRELSVYSQNGEDGILLYLLSVVGTGQRRFVELGIGDGRECCCANLALNWGWSGVMVEGNWPAAERARKFYSGRADVKVKAEFVTAENVDSLVGPEPVEMLSVDIDGNDYWVWRAVSAPVRVAVVEYNASFGPRQAVTIPYDPAFDYTTASPHRLYHGASLAALAKLAAEKGMALVGCDSQGVNAFFVDRSRLSGPLRELSAEEAWRPMPKRARRFSQTEQERILAGYPVVSV
jgi:hypothetical protein